VQAHATRLYALLAVGVVLGAHWYPALPVDAVLTGAGGLLGIGEAAQRATKRVANSAARHRK
jgi:hypothetical protein